MGLPRARLNAFFDVPVRISEVVSFLSVVTLSHFVVCVILNLPGSSCRDHL